MDAITAMMTRRSVRKFTDAPVKEEDLHTILECGRLAPSGANRQPWKFIIVTDQAMKDAVAAGTVYGKFINQAPVVIAVACCDAEAACPNEDTGAATENMLLAAHALGYGGCWIGANSNETAHNVGKVLGVKEGWRIMAVFCIGVPAEEPAQRPKKALDEIVVYNHFE